MKPLLHSQFLSQLKRHKINGKRKKNGNQKGSRLASYYGSSLEFSDYQMYELGDDVRQIDWNVYARTEKVYIKRYLDERELKIHIYLDCSNSMVKEEKKWKRAKELAGAISFMALSNDDRLSLHCIGANHPGFEKKGSRDAKGILFEIQQLSPINDYEKVDFSFFEKVVKEVRKKSSLSFIISDGLEPLPAINEALSMLSKKREMVYFIQLLDEEEIAPHYLGDIKLIDSEKNNEVNISFNRSIIERYKERIQAHCNGIKSLCGKWGFDYLQIDDSQPLNEVVFKHFKENGWIR